MGFLENVLDVMKKTNEKLRETCLKCVVTLLDCSEGQNKNVDYEFDVIKFFQKERVEIVLNTMKTYAASASIQQNGCELLHYLCSLPATMDTVKDADLHALSIAAKAHETLQRTLTHDGISSEQKQAINTAGKEWCRFSSRLIDHTKEKINKAE